LSTIGIALPAVIIVPLFATTGAIERSIFEAGEWVNDQIKSPSEFKETVLSPQGFAVYSLPSESKETYGP